MGGEAPHCGYLQPLYLPDACDAPADALKLDLDSFNTDITSQCNGGIVAQANEPEVCVLRYATISLSAGVTAKITGRRVFALVADERVEIDGV